MISNQTTLYLSVEILSGVIKSVKKDGEWKVILVQWTEVVYLLHCFQMTLSVYLCCVNLGSHRRSHQHADSVLLL